MPSFEHRLSVAMGSRVWRGNIRTIIGLNDTSLAQRLTDEAKKDTDYREIYAHYRDEDENNKMMNYPGDLRAALMPMLAYKAMQHIPFKWLLYADDDTFFFMDNVKRHLEDYDHTLPIVLTDHLMPGHPITKPRCLPCHLSSEENEAIIANSSYMDPPKYRPYFGCPHCTPEHACRWYNESEGRRGSECKSGGWIYGGAGAILSRGLLDLMAKNFAGLERCCSNTKSLGGDITLAICLNDVFNISITDPGTSVLAGFKKEHLLFSAFTPGWYVQCFREIIRTGGHHTHPDCVWQMDNALTVHLVARNKAYKRVVEEMVEMQQLFEEAMHTQALAALETVQGVVTNGKCNCSCPQSTSSSSSSTVISSGSAVGGSRLPQHAWHLRRYLRHRKHRHYHHTH